MNPYLAEVRARLERTLSEHECAATEDIPKLLTLLSQKDAVIQRMRGGLQFYASKETWSNEECDRLNAEGGFFPYDITRCPISDDNGEVARECLQACEGMEGGK